jgi:hypothetical protein
MWRTDMYAWQRTRRQPQTFPETKYGHRDNVVIDYEANTITLRGTNQRRGDVTAELIKRHGFKECGGVWGDGVYAALPGTRSYDTRPEKVLRAERRQYRGCYADWGRHEFYIEATLPIEDVLVIETLQEYEDYRLNMWSDDAARDGGIAYNGTRYRALLVLDCDGIPGTDMVNQWVAPVDTVHVVCYQEAPYYMKAWVDESGSYGYEDEDDEQ